MRLTVSFSRCALHLLLQTLLVYAQPALFGNNTSSSAPVLTSNLSTLSNSDKNCWFREATLQVLYFPPASEGLNKSDNVTSVATTLVSDGFTFTSPSIYVVFDTLAARYTEYIHKGDDIDVTVFDAGGVYYNITRAYPPGYIQTLPPGCYHGFGAYNALNPQDYIDPPQNWQILDKCVMYFTFQTQIYGGPNATLMALSPLISLPADIKTYDPAWKDCLGNGPYNPLWDPPRVLTPVAALGPAITAMPDATMTSTAEPEAQPSNPQPMSTPVAVLRPTLSTLATGNIKPATTNGPIPSAIADTGVLDSADPVIPFFNIPIPGHDSENDGSILTSTTRFRPTEALDAAAAMAESSHPEAKLQLIPKPSPIATVKENTIFGLADGAVSVHDQILKAEDPAITVGGMAMSVGSSAVHIGQSSYMYTDPAVTRLAALESVDGNAIHPLAQGGIEIGRSTVMPGEQITIGGSVLSVGSKNVVIGSSTYDIHSIAATAQRPSLPVIIGESVSVLKDGKIVVGHSTIPIGEATTISGIPVSVGSKVIVVGGSRYTLPTPAPHAPSFGHQIVSPASDGAIIIGSLTVSKDTQTTISGTPVSVGSDFIVIGSSTYPIPSRTLAIFNLVGQSFHTLSGGGILFDGATVLPNSQTTISGTPISVGSDLVVIGGKTYPWPSKTGTSDVLSGYSIQRLPGGAFVFDGMTLPPNIQTTISGTPVSVGSDLIVIGGKTYPWPSKTGTPEVLSGYSIQRLPGGALVFDGMTLPPNIQTTISGTRISIGSGNVVINGVTQSHWSEAPSPTSGLGAIIISIFGFKPDSENEHSSTHVTTSNFNPSGLHRGSSASATSTPTVSVTAATTTSTSNAFTLAVDLWILSAGISMCLISIG